MQHRHFAISTNFLPKEQSAKAKLKDGLGWSTRAIQTSQMKKEGVDHQIWRPGIFGSRGRRKLDDQNVDHSTTVRPIKKLGKVRKLTGWAAHELSDNNKAERIRIFTDFLQRNEQTPFLKNLVTGDESWLLFKNVKRRNVCVSPKGIRKPSTVRSQCGVCHLWTWFLLIVPSPNDNASFQPFSKW